MSRPRGRALRNRFPRERRVRRRREFKEIFDRGARFQGRYVTVLMRPNGQARSRLGIVASRKLGGAVERNRAKRLIREIFRQHVPREGAPGVDAVVIPRRELLDAAFPSLVADFKHVWQRGTDKVARRR